MRRCLPLLFLFACALPALGKSLSWPSFDVTARLDADGKLHVRERQTMLFDGDWNGGERTFNLRKGQSLEMQGMARDGVPMRQGDLDIVDNWSLLDGYRLRWRSRLPSDPPFEQRTIVYDIDYTLAGILQETGDGHYVLDHDFGMPERDGPIGKYSLQLDFDPAWRDVTQVVHTERVVPPHLGVVVTRTMRYAGAGTPLAKPAGVSKTTGGLIAAAILAALVFVFILWYQGEQQVGRFDPIPVSQINDAWLQEHVLALKPEVAGAAWDDSVGAPEVAAVLARMAQEKKISTRAEKRVLHMSLLVDRESLQGYEKELIKKLFVNKSTETDTDTVKSHYAGRGFNPGEIVEKGLKPDLDRLPGWQQQDSRRKPARSVMLFVIALALMAIAAVFSESSRPFVFAWGFSSVFLMVFGAIIAVLNSKAIGPVAWRTIFIAIFCFPVTLGAVLTALNANAWDVPAITPIALGALAVACWHVLLDAMRISGAPEKIAFRRRLMSARRYFIEQLRSPQPNLRDDWFPYLLAFGLGNNVDGWFRAHGASSSSSTSSSNWSSSSSSSSGSSSSSWTGGGGAFGGAGATGGWAMAAGTLAAGVAAPSSSGGGGGGGGGGGSSGGGGGGGW